MKSEFWEIDALQGDTELLIHYSSILITADLMRVFDIMMTFGGSPTAVAVPPMLENTTSAIKMGRGSRFNT